MKTLKLFVCILCVSVPIFSFDREILVDSFELINGYLKFPEGAIAAVHSTMDVTNGDVQETVGLLDKSEVNSQSFYYDRAKFTTERKDDSGTDIICYRSAFSPTGAFRTNVFHCDPDDRLSGYSYFKYVMRPHKSIKRQWELRYGDNNLIQAICTSMNKQPYEDTLFDTITYSFEFDTLNSVYWTTVKEGDKKILLQKMWDSVGVDTAGNMNTYEFKQFAEWNDTVQQWVDEETYTITHREEEPDGISNTYTQVRNFINRSSNTRYCCTKLYYDEDTLRYVHRLYYDNNEVFSRSTKFSYVYGGETKVITKAGVSGSLFRYSLDRESLRINGLKPNESCVLINAQGRVVLRASVDNKGTLTFPVVGIGSGVLFLKTESRVLRFMK